MPSGWSAAGSSGRGRRRTAWSPSAPRSSLTCWTGSTGAIPCTPSGPRRRAECDLLTQVADLHRRTGRIVMQFKSWRVYPRTYPTKSSELRVDKVGEAVTETLDVVPGEWVVTEHVREKYSCRDCETIAQPPAPFHTIARGYAGPSLLAMILTEKYANHQPLNRQSERYAREGIEIPLSTMADHVGAAAAALTPIHDLIRCHVFGAERIHGDDTTVPVLAKGKTRTGRLWTYVRDDRPFGGKDPPAAAFFYSADRRADNPQAHLAAYTGILQADAYAGFNSVYALDRKPGLIVEAACWAHGRRKLFELADIAAKARAKKPAAISPIAFEAVRRIDRKSVV